MRRIGLEGRDPWIGRIAQQGLGRPVPRGRGRQEGLIPGCDVRNGSGRRLGHGGTRKRQQQGGGQEAMRHEGSGTTQKNEARP
ncbi:hypothetical protein D3C86_2115730 [compost metagenome]